MNNHSVTMGPHIGRLPVYSEKAAKSRKKYWQPIYLSHTRLLLHNIGLTQPVASIPPNLESKSSATFPSF